MVSRSCMLIFEGNKKYVYLCVCGPEGEAYKRITCSFILLTGSGRVCNNRGRQIYVW